MARSSGVSVLSTCRPSQIRLAIAPGAHFRRLAALLALQREEEPDVILTFDEVSSDMLMAGLHEGRYDVGFALETATNVSLNSQPLWRENLAVALPLRHPLLSKVTLTLDDLLDEPIFRWQVENCPTLAQPLASRLSDHPDRVQYVHSFGMLATWVAAGYGIGITAQSRIHHARAWDIDMRPFTDAPYEVITHLLRPAQQLDTTGRFVRRAQQLAKRDTPD